MGHSLLLRHLQDKSAFGRWKYLGLREVLQERCQVLLKFGFLVTGLVAEAVLARWQCIGLNVAHFTGPMDERDTRVQHGMLVLNSKGSDVLMRFRQFLR